MSHMTGFICPSPLLELHFYLWREKLTSYQRIRSDSDFTIEMYVKHIYVFNEARLTQRHSGAPRFLTRTPINLQRLILSTYYDKVILWPNGTTHAWMEIFPWEN
jgi:hypothetical protein